MPETPQQMNLQWKFLKELHTRTRLVVHTAYMYKVSCTYSIHVQGQLFIQHTHTRLVGYIHNTSTCNELCNHNLASRFLTYNASCTNSIHVQGQLYSCTFRIHVQGQLYIQHTCTRLVEHTEYMYKVSCTYSIHVQGQLYIQHTRTRLVVYTAYTYKVRLLHAAYKYKLVVHTSYMHKVSCTYIIHVQGQLYIHHTYTRLVLHTANTYKVKCT